MLCAPEHSVTQSSTPSVARRQIVSEEVIILDDGGGGFQKLATTTIPPFVSRVRTQTTADENDSHTGLIAVQAGAGFDGEMKGETKAGKNDENVYESYERNLRRNCVRSANVLNCSNPSYSFKSKIQIAKSNRSKKHLKRIRKEIKGLQKHLPIHFNSSSFVRVDENCPYAMRIMIAGPVDTPYESGLFTFDMLLPPSYPKQPPEVILLTTGAGTVRFSPNLYQDGKVCLSLLGTWQGPGWDPKRSSILQVILSIQNLIMVEHPHAMEPGFGGWGETKTRMNQLRNRLNDMSKSGSVSMEQIIPELKSADQTDNWGGSDPEYEAMMGNFITASGCNLGPGQVDFERFISNHFLKVESLRYNARIHVGTVQWAILDVLRNPDPLFAEVIQRHFGFKKGRIAEQLHQWDVTDVVLPHRHSRLMQGAFCLEQMLGISVGRVEEKDFLRRARAFEAMAKVCWGDCDQPLRADEFVTV